MVASDNIGQRLMVRQREQGLSIFPYMGKSHYKLLPEVGNQTLLRWAGGPYPSKPGRSSIGVRENDGLKVSKKHLCSYAMFCYALKEECPILVPATAVLLALRRDNYRVGRLCSQLDDTHALGPRVGALRRQLIQSSDTTSASYR